MSNVVNGSGHAFIRHQEIGGKFEGVYYVESVFVKQTVQKKDYSDISLRDRSGGRSVKYWGVIQGLAKGDWVFASMNVEEYLGGPSIIAKNIEKVDAPTELSDYIPTYDDAIDSAGRFDAVRKELAELEAVLGDTTAGALVDEVYGNSSLFDKFIVAPGSSKPHYGRQGGLLANTVRIAESCQKMSDAYGLDKKERSVVLAAALICRIGAVDALEFKDCIPVMTKNGMMLGVGNLTMTRISSALRRVVSVAAKNGKIADPDIVVRILHAIASHDAKCVVPMTKEAMVLSSAYRVDSEMVDAVDFIANDTNTLEEFTAWDASMGRRYYTGIRTT